jgi:hypothetical protein
MAREMIAIVQPVDTGIVPHLSIVTNWFEQLKRVAPGRAGKVTPAPLPHGPYEILALLGRPRDW